MGHGYHMGMGMGYYGSYILIAILVVLTITVVFILKNKQSPSPFIIRLIDILKGKYASGVINADEFNERKQVVQEITYSSQYTPILLERYAQLEVDTKEFFKIKNEIESNLIDKELCEQLAKGEISYSQYKGRQGRNRDEK